MYRGPSHWLSMIYNSIVNTNFQSSQKLVIWSHFHCGLFFPLSSKSRRIPVHNDWWLLTGSPRLRRVYRDNGAFLPGCILHAGWWETQTKMICHDLSLERRNVIARVRTDEKPSVTVTTGIWNHMLYKWSMTSLGTEHIGTVPSDV